MIDFVATILKSSALFVAEHEGGRPNARTLYATTDSAWSVLIPVSVRGTVVWYDKVSYLEVDQIHPGTPSRTIAVLHHDKVPAPDLERRAPDRIRNTYFVTVFETVRGKFMRSRTMNLPGGDRQYFYFFKSALGRPGVTMRLNYLLGGLFLNRARRIRESLPFPPYKGLSAIVDFFETLGSRLYEPGKRYMDRVRGSAGSSRSADQGGPSVSCADENRVAAAILSLCQYLPAAGPMIRGIITMYYARHIPPGGGSGPPKK